MKSATRLAQQLPALDMSDHDADMLAELAETLALHNIQQFNTLLMTKEGFADPRRWKELKRRDNVRIYRERARATVPGIPVTPSLLLLGTLEGSLDDVMYGMSAHSDEAIRLRSTCTQDGVVDSKVLKEIVRPSIEEPFRHVSVKWRLHANARDYVSLDASGVALTVKRERIGYSIMHSVAFAQVPSFDTTHGVERGNMSVCALYRQKTPTTVEVYVRGFFDFNSQNDMMNSLSLQALATQWISFARGVECAQMKKLVWQMRKNAGCTAGVSLDDDLPNSSSSVESAALASYAASLSMQPGPSSLSFSITSASPSFSSVTSGAEGGQGCCSLCRRSFGLLSSSRKKCKICTQSVCNRCSSKRLVCVLAPDRRTVLEKRRTFCASCLDAVDKTDPVAVAREELLSSCSLHVDWLAEAQHAVAAAHLPSAVRRHSRVSSASRRSSALYA